jgi:hypothetical protein
MPEMPSLISRRGKPNEDYRELKEFDLLQKHCGARGFGYTGIPRDLSLGGADHRDGRRDARG